jgi:chromosome segregation ATPase
MNGLLGRLEAQAEEIGRLDARAESFERVARAERDARRRLADQLKRERKAAGALNERAEAAEAAWATQAEELERLRQGVRLADQQMQALWMRLHDAERELAMRSRPLWRRLLRRAPA